ncbi:hypothetical protein [Eisenbergiella tayi]|nr:hypothetical protein [Eisenbergiella tayi]
MLRTILFDMYGVILKESKGNFVPYTFNYFPVQEHERLIRQFKEEQLFTKAGNGLISSDDFLLELGFTNPQRHMKNYLENYLGQFTRNYTQTTKRGLLTTNKG